MWRGVGVKVQEDAIRDRRWWVRRCGRRRGRFRRSLRGRFRGRRGIFRLRGSAYFRKRWPHGRGYHPRHALGIVQQDTPCLLYTSDAADDLLCVDLGGRRIIKKKHN